MAYKKKEYYLITMKGRKSRIGQVYNLVINDMGIVELNPPKSLIHLTCVNNHLKELEIPHNCETVECFNNNIKSITVPNSVVYLVIDDHVKITNEDELNPEIVIERVSRDDWSKEEYWNFPRYVKTTDDLYRPTKDRERIANHEYVDEIV